MNQIGRWKEFDLALRASRAEDIGIDDPRPELRIGAIIAMLFFVLFLGWAAFSPMDATAYAPGQLQVSGQRQSVQHREGGIVAAIHVREGQKVRAGDVLIELRGGEVLAQENALAAQMVNLVVQRARLQAEQQGLAEVQWPTSFGDIHASADQVARATAVQSGEFRARRSLLEAGQRVLGVAAQESTQTAGGYRARMASSVEQERLITEELNSLKPVAEKGFVSKSRLRALERARADLAGESGQYRASIAEAHLAAERNRLRQIEADEAYRERATTELKAVSTEIDELTPKYRAARDQLERLQIRAPVSGSVVGLSVFSVSGVIFSGEKLMDVVPDRANLVVAARIAPEDIDDVTLGQKAELRITGMRDRELPLLSAVLTRLSADALVDEKLGVSFYTAEFKVPQSEISKIRSVRGPQFRLRPGTPVEVTIPIRKRTALQYAFEPLLGTVRRSGGEH
jgi:HlyD family secretion protein